MLSEKQALDQALMLYNDYRSLEQRRLDRIDKALQPQVDENGMPKPRIELPDDAPELLTKLTVESETNYLPLLLDTYAQIMRVDGYLTKSSPGGRDPWETWQRNRMDSRQTALVRSALGYGSAYATALPGEDDLGESFAATRLYSPRTMTALYDDDEWDDWPLWALAVGTETWRLYGPGETHTFDVSERQLTNVTGSGVVTRFAGGQHMRRREAQEHDLGVTPVIRYRDKHYLPHEKMLGIVEPLLTVQRRMDRTSANQMIAQQIAIFRQKYIIGWVPESEEEEMKASIAQVHHLDMDPQEVEFGEWAATQIEPYITAGNQVRRDFAAIGQIPSQAMGVDGISNISDATLAGLEAAKNRRASTITTCMGESHEQLLRTYATIDGNEEAARDFGAEVIWRDFESRSYGATIDGITKLVQVGYPAEIAIEDIPGMTGQKLKRVQQVMRREAARKELQAQRIATAAANTPSVDDTQPVAPENPNPNPPPSEVSPPAVAEE